MWPGFLIVPILDLVSPAALARPYMVPTKNGAYFGVTVKTESSGPQLIERFKFDGKSASHPPLHLKTGELISHSFINTFISDVEMTKHQLALKLRVSEFIDRNHGILLFFLLSKIMLIDDEPDIMGLDGVLAGEVDGAMAELAALVHGPIWQSGIRAPQDGPFIKFFIAQGMLEKDEASYLQ